MNHGMRNMYWNIVEKPNGSKLHIVPANDIRVHGGDDCWCGPTMDDGVMVHHAADGREETEGQWWFYL